MTGDADTGIAAARSPAAPTSSSPSGGWRAAGGETVVMPAGLQNRAISLPKLPPGHDGPPRNVLSLVFGDVLGFARLAEVDLPRFWSDVMGAAAEILDAQGDHVRARNGWGDAIHAVTDEPTVAAGIVLDLQERLAKNGGMASRIGVYGAVFAMPSANFACRYVGQVALAKNYGTFPRCTA